MPYLRFSILITLCWALLSALALAQSPTEPSTPENAAIWNTTDEFVLLDEQPVPVNMDVIADVIEYPDSAWDNGISGKVLLRVLVDASGKYVRHKVLQTPHQWLTAEVERHIAKLQFTPAIQNGRAIATWVTVPFDFRIQGRGRRNTNRRPAR